MSIMKISEATAKRLLAARSSYVRKGIRKGIMAEIRREFGIPYNVKMVIAVETPDNPDYCVIRNKYTRLPLDNGVNDTPAVTVQTKPVEVEVPAAKKVAAKPAAKKVAAKPAAKKVAAKPAAKKVAAKSKSR